jgi:hypothetical protein
MGPNPVDLDAAVSRIVAIRISIEPESECREEAEAIMIAMVPVMIAIPVTISHPHSSHLVLLESARRKICSHGHHAAVAHTAAVAEAAAHMCAGRRHQADAERGRGNKSDSYCPKHGILLNKSAWCLTVRRDAGGPRVRSVALTSIYVGAEIADVSGLLARARNCANLAIDCLVVPLGARGPSGTDAFAERYCVAARTNKAKAYATMAQDRNNHSKADQAWISGPGLFW